MEVSARGRPRSSALDRRILAATRDALAAGGYQQLSMEAVARAAGVGKQTLYRRWPRRPLLVMDAILGPGGQGRGQAGEGGGAGKPASGRGGATAGSGTAGAPGRLGRTLGTGSLAGDLATIAAAQTRADQAVGLDALRGLVADCLGDADLTEVLRARLLRPRLRALALAAERAARRGELAPGIPPALVAEAMAGALLTHVLLPGAPRDELAFGRSLARLVTEGAAAADRSRQAGA
jgi:hypothetical protein